jgi:Flp pilus assembly protein TadD
MLAQMGRTDEAITHYRKAWEMNPVDLDHLENLVFALVKEGRLTDATSVLQNSLALAKSAGDEARTKTITQTLTKLYEAIISSQATSKAHAQ